MDRWWGLIVGRYYSWFFWKESQKCVIVVWYYLEWMMWQGACMMRPHRNLSRSHKFLRTQHEVVEGCRNCKHAWEHLTSEVDAWLRTVLTRVWHTISGSCSVISHIIKLCESVPSLGSTPPCITQIFSCCVLHSFILFGIPMDTTRTNWLGKHHLAITLSFRHRDGPATIMTW